MVLNLKGIHPEDVGVEIVMTKTDEKGIRRIQCSYELELNNSIDTMAFYSTNINFSMPGMFEYALRIFPKHSEMTYKMDFNLVRWI